MYNKEYFQEYYKKNKERILAKNKEWLEKNKKSYRATQRKWTKDNYNRRKETMRWSRIKSKYGLTKEDWYKIYEEQDGRCYLCLRTEEQIRKSKSKYLSVDHCHTSGKIRGLLCRFCNQTLTGFVKDDPAFAARIYTYLTRETDYGHAPE